MPTQNFAKGYWPSNIIQHKSGITKSLSSTTSCNCTKGLPKMRILEECLKGLQKSHTRLIGGDGKPRSECMRSLYGKQWGQVYYLSTSTHIFQIYGHVDDRMATQWARMADSVKKFSRRVAWRSCAGRKKNLIRWVDKYVTNLWVPVLDARSRGVRVAVRCISWLIFRKSLTIAQPPRFCGVKKQL